MGIPTDDMEIVQRVLTGDTEAFGVLVHRYSGKVYGLAFGMLHDAERAEDVAQETFLRAYEHLDSFRGASAFATWLYRIAYNRAAEYCRRRQRPFGRLDERCRAVADEEVSAERYDPETVVRMRHALLRLPPDDRALVTLFYEEECTVAEIAQMMNLSQANVKVRLYRIRRRLRQYMEE